MSSPGSRDQRGGTLSEYLEAMDLGKMVNYDYQPYFQAALYTPELITKK